METVNIKFVLSDGTIVPIIGNVGETLLCLKLRDDKLHEFEFACEGSLACTTCHVIVDQDHYHMTGKVSEAEEDMLDLALGVTSTSRLGCQVLLTKELEGACFRIPSRRRPV